MPTALITFILLAAGSGAQHATATSRIEVSNNRVAEIRVTGSHRFQASELIKATGLRVGQDGNDAALKSAADRLASSGMFSDVSYSYIAAQTGTKVEYTVKDTEKLLPAHFDNFVWLSSPELLHQLEEMEPLFRGELPNAGDMYQRLAGDVKAILERIQVHADVKVFPQVPMHGGDVIGFMYQVEGVKLPIRSVQFLGASSPFDKTLSEAAQSSLFGTDYSQTGVRSIAALDLLPQYLSRGFLRAEFGIPDATLVNTTSGDVAVTLPVKEGLSYSLAEIRWSGNTAFAISDLAKALHVQIGKAANEIQLDEDLGAISKVYGTRGYLDASLKPKFSFDDAAKTVAIEVDVHEGDQYHMGDLRFEGMNEKIAETLRNSWRLKAGDVYDTSYFQLFFKTVSREIDLSRVAAQLRTNPDRTSKIVNVTVQFMSK